MTCAVLTDPKSGTDRWHTISKHHQFFGDMQLWPFRQAFFQVTTFQWLGAVSSRHAKFVLTRTLQIYLWPSQLIRAVLLASAAAAAGSSTSSTRSYYVKDLFLLLRNSHKPATTSTTSTLCDLWAALLLLGPVLVPSLSLLLSPLM